MQIVNIDAEETMKALAELTEISMKLIQCRDNEPDPDTQPALHMVRTTMLGLLEDDFKDRVTPDMIQSLGVMMSNWQRTTNAALAELASLQTEDEYNEFMASIGAVPINTTMQ